MSEQAAILRLRTTVDREGATTSALVHCPRRDRSTDVSSCVECTHLRGLEWDARRGGKVTCSVDVEPLPGDRRADIAEAAARARVHEILGPSTTCVTEDVSIAQLKHTVAETGARTVAVVDEHGKLRGLISRTDLTTAADFGRVADIMPARVHSLREDAPVGFAIALMAHENINEVPVVTAGGAVVGVCHALDALRWVAREMGHVVPPSRGGAPGEPLE